VTPWTETDRSPNEGAGDVQVYPVLFVRGGPVATTRWQENEAMDKLGPLTKAALRDAATSWSAVNVLEEFGRRGWWTRRQDAEMAALIRERDGSEK
jgi:hypothetical protein